MSLANDKIELLTEKRVQKEFISNVLVSINCVLSSILYGHKRRNYAFNNNTKKKERKNKQNT